MGLTQVETDGIKDDAVTLAKRAGVARGKIVIGDASGNPAALAKGSAGQVLQHDGTDISWGTVQTSTEGESVTSTTNSNEASTKFLRADGDGTCSWQVPPDTTVGGATGADFNDDTQVRFGTGNDLVIKHTGSDASIVNTTGALNIDSGVGLDITTGGDITVGSGHPIIIEAITGNAGGHVKFREGTTGGTNAVSIKGPETIASDYSIVLPNAAPTENGQALTATTAGVASWSTVTSKLAAPTLTGPTGILTSGTATLTISNYSSDCSYTFASLTNCTIGTVNASGEFVVTNTGSHNSSFTIKATTTSLGLADSDTTAKSFTPSLSAPTINSPADAAANTNVVYTVTSTTGDDDKIILDMGSSNFTYGSVSHGSGSKVGNTVEVTGFTTNNPAITLQLTTVGNYSVKAKSVDTGGTFADSAYSATDTITCLNAYNVSFYVQGAGGGGAVTGGGGGAGGHRSSWNSETSGGGGSAESPIQMVVGTQYTCTIGGGGSGGSGWGANGSNGQNSSITVTSGGADVITSTGGGYGSHGSTGGSGGCGGGSGYGQTSNGGSGTANQGYDGGSGSGTHGKPGGGGGGCSGAGGNAHGGQGGSGGYGRESTISGSAVTIGGGGGSGSRGSNSPGSGRNGGGHGKTCGNCSGGSGDTNSGSGGGSAGGDWSSGSGGTGGSGIIYLRMATSDYSGTTTNSPNVTTDGSDTIIKFTGTGTYTA